MRILFKNPKVLTMKDGPVLFEKDVLVDGERIIKVEANIDKDGVDKVIDASNCVLMPGFKNAHSHAAMTFARGTNDTLTLQGWLENHIFPMESKLRKGDVYHLSKGGFLEMLTSGITGCYDMYMQPKEVADAAVDFGFRCTVLGVKNEGQFVENEFIDNLEYFESLKNNLVKYNLGFHAEYTLEKHKVGALKKLKEQYKASVSTHSCETKSEVEDCKARRNGLTPIQYFESEGFLDYGGTIFHGVHLEDKDIEILKKHDASVVVNFGSNTKLASGVAEVTRLLKNGINVAIGTDGCGSNDCLDMFKEMSLLYSLTKIHDGTPVICSAYEILKMATVNGAKAMEFKDCNYIAEGQYADLILIDLDRPNMQPLGDIISNIVYSGSKDNIKLTMINGKILYKDRKFYVGESYKKIYRDQQRITERLKK